MYPGPDVGVAVVDIEPGINQADVISTCHLDKDSVLAGLTTLTSQLHRVMPGSGLMQVLLISLLKLSRSVKTLRRLLFLGKYVCEIIQVNL